MGSSDADITWSDDGIAQSLQGLVSSVQSNPAAGTLDAKVLGGLADVQVQPHIVGGKIVVDTSNATLLGFGVPTDLVDSIVQTMTKGLQSYPLDMHPSRLTVTDSGIEVKLSGGATTMQGDNNAANVRC